MTDVCFSDLAKYFGAFTIEPECDFPSFVAVPGSRLRNMIAAEIGFLFHQHAFFERFSVSLGLLLIGFDPVFRRNHFLSFVNRFQALAVVRIHESELKLGYA